VVGTVNLDADVGGHPGPRTQPLLADRELRQGVGAAQERFSFSGRRGAGEDEAEIARAFRQPDDPWPLAAL